jgi:integrase
MEIPWEDGEYVGRNIKYLAPGPQSGHRFRLIKFVNDHRGERRPVKGTWKFSDMLSRKSARARAEARRDEVDQNKKNITWLRKEFPEPKKKPKPKNLLGHLGFKGAAAYDDPNEDSEPPVLGELTFEEWMELGLTEHRDGKWEEDRSAPVAGYLHRIMTRNGGSDWAQKRAVYRHLRQWGRIQDKTLDDIDLEDVRKFLFYLETCDSISARETIDKYVKVMRGAVGEWADRTSVYNPVKGDLRIPKHKIEAEKSPDKARSREHVLALRWALVEWLDSCPRPEWLPYRALTRYIFEVQAHTGLRVGEILFMETKHHDAAKGTLSVRGAWSRDVGPTDTKVARQQGKDGRAHREIPLVDPANMALVEWLERRTEFGFPSPEDEPILFPKSEGGYTHDDRVRHHYKQACKKAKIEMVLPSWMRATVITRLAHLHCPAEIRKALVGHEVEGIQARYLSMQAESARPFLDGIWDIDHDD